MPKKNMETPAPKEQERTLELLRREDVRTMAKDMAFLRERDALKERTKIGNLPARQAGLLEAKPLKEAELQADEVADARSSASELEAPAPLMPHQKRGFGKLFIRVLLVLIILFVIINAIALAFFLLSKDSNKAGTVPAPSAPGAQEPTPSPAPEPSLFSLFQTLLSKEDAQGLTKMLVKDKVAELPFPSQLKEIIQDEFTIFSFVSQDKKRLGFIFKLQNPQGVQGLLQQWEPSMEGDLKTLFDIIGQKGNAYVPFFRQTSYQNTLIRFQTFSAKDFGLCYAIVDSTLVFASSLESIKAVIDELMTNN